MRPSLREILSQNNAWEGVIPKRGDFTSDARSLPGRTSKDLVR